jgi:hypothetical protein
MEDCDCTNGVIASDANDPLLQHVASNPRPIAEIRSDVAAVRERIPPGVGAYRPVHFTPEEVASGSAAIRWVTSEGAAGRPTLHDVLDYIERRGDAIDCTCERCTAWKALNAGALG